MGRGIPSSQKGFSKLLGGEEGVARQRKGRFTIRERIVDCLMKAVFANWVWGR